jgi:hypothetical protein
MLGAAHILKHKKACAVGPRASEFYPLDWTEPDYEWGSACFGRPEIKPGTGVYLGRWAKDIEYLYYLILVKTARGGIILKNRSSEHLPSVRV